MKTAVAFAAGAAALAGFSASAPADAAQPRAARCVIRASGESYTGPCSFLAEGGGSFSLSPVRRRLLAGGATVISVGIVAPGRAEVRGLTADGVNSRWGEARRSARDRACWVGSDFSICAY